MIAQTNRHALSDEGSARTYSPELLAHAQDLLAELADLDCSLEKDLEAARNIPCSEPARLAAISELRHRHRERYAHLSTELALLEERIERTLGPD